MRIIFAGTPAFAAAALQAIADSRHQVVLVLTQPDRPAGRGMQLQPSPVKVLAGTLGIPVRQPRTLRDPAEWPALMKAAAEAMVVAAYGLILPQAVLDIPPRGALNIHASLLPRWRGAAPIQRALLAGDRQTGISIMQMDAGLDTGPVVMAEPIAIEPEDTAGTLQERLAALGARLIVTALDRLEQGELTAVPQPAEGVTYAAKIDKAEARIDWSADAEVVHRQVRAFNPSPGASTQLRGIGVKIWSARLDREARGEPGAVLALTREGPLVACGTGGLVLAEVQRAGGRRMTGADFARGLGMSAGERFGS